MMPKWHHFADVFVQAHVIVLVLVFSFHFGLDLKCISLLNLHLKNTCMRGFSLQYTHSSKKLRELISWFGSIGKLFRICKGA